MRQFGVITVLLSLANPAFARDPILNLPIDCTLGDTCFIQNYVDADPSGGAADFTCGALSYDGHKGTDFALPSILSMWDGVDVLASAPGTVRAIRDGVEDFPQGVDGAPDVTGIECGNGVMVEHGGGWTTQYCHMMNGSLAVKPGQRLAKGQRLGSVGLSGKTQFPHVHMVLRQGDEVIDPFNPDGLTSCSETGSPTLWQDTITYRPTGVLSVGFSNALPEYDMIKAGTAHASTLPADSPALVVFGYAYGGLKGDIMRLSLAGPSETIVTKDVTLEHKQAQYYRAIGRQSETPWPVGGYRAMVQIIRDGEMISDMSTDIQITH